MTEQKMIEEKNKSEKKAEVKLVETKKEVKSADVKKEIKVENNVGEEVKTEEKKPEIKKDKVSKKDEAFAKGENLHASKKHCMYICSFIKGKKIDDAIKDLEDVIKFKQAVPFKGEIPHRKGKVMMSGRYPVKVSGIIISMLKGLKGNVIANGMDLEKTRISEGISNWASRPAKSGGRRFKRTNVVLKAREFEEKKTKMGTKK